MPNQLNSDSVRLQGLHPDAYLSNFALSYMQSLKKYVADQVFPRIDVQFENDIYPIWDRAEDFRIDPDAPRRPGAVSTELEVMKADGQYRAQGYAKHVVLPDRELNQAKPVFDLEGIKTARLTHRIVAMREKRCADLLAAAAIPNGNKVDLTSYKWSDYTASQIGANDPFAKLNAAKLAVLNASGVEPNRMLIPVAIAITLSQHPAFVDRFKTWTNTTADTVLPPQILGMTPVIARAQYNTVKRNPTKAAAGTDVSLTSIWGNQVVLYYVDDDQEIDKLGVETLTSFKSFWVAKNGGVYRWYENARRATIIEQEEVIAEAVTAPPTVALLQNVL